MLRGTYDEEGSRGLFVAVDGRLGDAYANGAKGRGRSIMCSARKESVSVITFQQANTVKIS